MKELVCNYALIRFLPYRETGEFVNVGVVVHAAEVNYFNFHLAGRRNRRVKAFFPELDTALYAASVESLRGELRRQVGQFEALAGLFMGERAVGEGLTAFRSMLRLRESLLHFAEPGMRLGVPGEVLDALYSDYVLRSFAQAPAYQETLMRNDLGRWLKEWGLRRHFKSDQPVGDPMFRLRLPFVRFEDRQPAVAIKPIDLDRADPSEVFDHGGLWVQRFSRLARRGHLPRRTIVPVSLPAGVSRVAADSILQELQAAGVTTANFAEPDRLHDLVADAS